VIGRNVRARPDIVREVVRCGHALGNHSYTHSALVGKSRIGVLSELGSTERAIADAVGARYPTRLFRPPFGARVPGTLRLARRMGFEPVMWTVTGWDWDGRSAQAIQHKVMQQVRGGDIILLHDGDYRRFGEDRSRTVGATARLIERYQAYGYTF